jgi:NAD(P)-dependent dehydrogenase (short-subunit alcohol dehydrogenase family)
MSATPHKTALVTDGANLIGRQIALALAERGWDVVVHYGQSEADALAVVKEILALGRRAAAVQCDLADEVAVKGLLARAGNASGGAPISCIVNNASLCKPDNAASFSQAMLGAHMHPNLVAPVLLAQALHTTTPAGSQAVIVNLLDRNMLDPDPDFLSHALSKAALHSATSLLAIALAPTVRVVGVVPGLALPSGEQAGKPGSRSSTPQDVAATVCFLAESRTITGTIIVVDAGQHLTPRQREAMPLAT